MLVLGRVNNRINHQPQLVDAGILNHQQLRKQKQLGDLCMGHEMGPILGGSNLMQMDGNFGEFPL